MPPAARRRLLGAATFATLVMLAASMPTLAAAGRARTPGSATGATGAAPLTSTTRVTRRVRRPGVYAVLVTVPSLAAAETISVFAGSQALHRVALSPGQPTALELHARAQGGRITVRTVAFGPPVQVEVALARQGAALPAPSIGSTGATGATGASGASGATGATGATGPRTFVAPRRGAYRRLVWSDEFSGPAGAPPDPANWVEDGDSGCGPGTLSTNTQTTANAALDGTGNLAITVRRGAGGSYTSAQLDSRGLVSMQYGEIEARIELPVGSGMCSAFWMVGDSTGVPCTEQCGEIDIMENISRLPDTAFATLHGPISGVSNFQQWEQSVTAATPLTGSWHTYGLIWRPNRITWTVDGLPYATATPSQLPPSARWVFDGHSFHILLDVAVGGWPGAPRPDARFPAAMRVDWVRVYD